MLHDLVYDRAHGTYSLALMNPLYNSYCLHAEPPRPLNITLTARLRSEEPAVSSYLHWSVADDRDMDEDASTATVDLNTSHHISLFPELVGSNQFNFTISTTSIWLTLFYDQDYKISVVARNCVGTSEPAELHVVWDG